MQENKKRWEVEPTQPKLKGNSRDSTSARLKKKKKEMIRMFQSLFLKY